MFGEKVQEEIISVQNIGRDLLKFSITVPKTRYFNVREEYRCFSLPTGMTKKIPIELVKVPQDHSCLDSVSIKTESTSLFM